MPVLHRALCPGGQRRRSIVGKFSVCVSMVDKSGQARAAAGSRPLQHLQVTVGVAESKKWGVGWWFLPKCKILYYCIEYQSFAVKLFLSLAKLAESKGSIKLRQFRAFNDEYIVHALCQFSIFSLKNGLKSSMFRVTRIRPFTLAIAAICPSTNDGVAPFDDNLARSLACHSAALSS